MHEVGGMRCTAQSEVNRLRREAKLGEAAERNEMKTKVDEALDRLEKELMEWDAQQDRAKQAKAAAEVEFEAKKHRTAQERWEKRQNELSRERYQVAIDCNWQRMLEARADATRSQTDGFSVGPGGWRDIR